MKKLLAIILGFALLQTSAIADDDKPITFSQLPKKAQKFVTDNFSTANISRVKMEDGFFEKNYEVKFNNGEEIEFNKRGDWTKVSCKRSSVPQQVVPQSIKNYVNSKHQHSKIVKIERESNEYEVKLDNGAEIKFNKNGDFKHYEKMGEKGHGNNNNRNNNNSNNSNSNNTKNDGVSSATQKQK